MRILIIEDADFVALTIKQLLPDCDVEYVRCFRSLRPLVAFDPSGLRSLEGEKFDLALVDGTCGTDFEGPSIVAELVSRQIPCVGISVESDMNKDMVRSGALYGLTKPVLMAGLHVRKVRPEELSSPSSLVTEKLARFGATYKSEFPDAQDEVDTILRANAGMPPKRRR